jgi:hypothetical protein
MTAGLAPFFDKIPPFSTHLGENRGWSVKGPVGCAVKRVVRLQPVPRPNPLGTGRDSAQLRPREEALTQQSRHQGQTGGPTFRRIGKRRSQGGRIQGEGASNDLESGVIS